MENVLELGRLRPVVTFPAAAAREKSDDARRVLVATIRAATAGDRDAFTQLYGSYVRMVHAILLGRVPRRDVDDLVQDVFVAAYTRLRELRDPGAFGGWLATIARNRATDYLRQTREQVELPAELPGGEAIEDETMIVLDVIRTLPDAYRETLLMRLLEGMTGAEIAERSGLTPASVRVNLHRGMKLLREKLGMEPGRAVEE